jgi:hypothetical protein
LHNGRGVTGADSGYAIELGLSGATGHDQIRHPVGLLLIPIEPVAARSGVARDGTSRVASGDTGTVAKGDTGALLDDVGRFMSSQV